MKKVLILGGSHRDIPLIKASQELGYFVITLGDRDYYIGHNYSNKVYKVDFNDLQIVRQIIIQEEVDFILPGCGEESYLNTVKLAYEFNMGSFDTLEIAQLIHNKWKFKEFCLDNNISTPKGYFYSTTLNINNLTFPIVVKPTSLSGGKGVEIVYTPYELETSIKTTKKVSNEIFLEEFIEGKLIAYSVFLQNQKIIYGFSGDDKSYLNQYMITTAYPISLNENVLKKIQEDIEKLASLLNLVDGMFHLQILIKNNIPYIIDVTRRIPGDLYPYLMEYCDNVKYSHAVVKAYTTGSINDEFTIKNKTQNFIIRHCIMPNKNGIYKNLHIHSSLKEKIIFQLDLLRPNTLIEDYLNTQIAIVFIQLENSDTTLIQNINSLIYMQID